jgi:CheY-like chemotaxis protein
MPQAKMKTILVVDEERSIVTAWKRILQSEGFRVLTANNGREGLFVANGEQPDLIITDRSTSIMYGVEFFRHLKLGRKFALIPVILTSADPLDAADAAVGDGFLLKPVSMQMLLASVQRFLNACPWRFRKLLRWRRLWRARRVAMLRRLEMKRVHIHIAVEDLEASTQFYSAMFGGVVPTIVKDGYRFIRSRYTPV